MTSKSIGFACDRCRAGKRKCDALKPVCSLCLRQSRSCVYTESPPRKRKYWDEEYVKGLEAQVQTLLSVVEAQNRTLPVPTPTPQAVAKMTDAEQSSDSPAESTPGLADLGPELSSHASPGARSHQAMEELCVMLWRTNIGDGVTIIDDPRSGSKYILNSDCQAQMPEGLRPPASILEYCQNMELLHEFATLFLENINSEHQFTQHTSTAFLVGFPHQSIHDVFVHSAIIATGATFSTREDSLKVGDAFAEFAETLVFSSCRHNPSAKVIQGLSMLSWRSLALGRDHLGWMFISLAAGMCVHLRLHVLALDECDARRLDADEEDIRTFWMFYIIDRTAISILGRNCALPWRRINVPSFDKSFASRTATLTQVAFAGQCELWYLHDRYMDQIFSNAFDTLPVSQQVHMLVSCQEALNGFYKSLDNRLQLSGDSTPKAVLMFHLAYQMAILISMPPFLRVFVRLEDADLKETSPGGSMKDLMLLVLRSLTTAATTTVRLVRDYIRSHGIKHPPNPVIIHHLLSAGIVHLMNATSQTSSVKYQSAYWVRKCLELLGVLQTHWPSRSERSIKVIRILAQRWRATSCLPLQLSDRIEPNNKDPFAEADEIEYAYWWSSNLQETGEPAEDELSSSWLEDLASFDVQSYFTMTPSDMDDFGGARGPTYGSIFPGIGDITDEDAFS